MSRTHLMFNSCKTDPKTGQPFPVCLNGDERIAAVEEIGRFRVLHLGSGHALIVRETWDECLKAMLEDRSLEGAKP